METEKAAEMVAAFRRHGMEPPGEYLWIVEHGMLGFDSFTQFTPWLFCEEPEIEPLAKRWPKAKIERELIPFARRQDMDELACFEFKEGKFVGICEMHYDLGPPVYVEFGAKYATVWEWLCGAIEDVKLWYEVSMKRK